ncbi:MAG: restriction endonuclease subunit S [Bryobacteraceae bacterium]
MTTTLADYCSLVSTQVDPRSYTDAIYIGLEHIRSGALRRSGGGLGRDVQSSKFAFSKNDLLYGKLRPYLDKAILADCDGICTTELLVLRPKPHVDPRFLACAVHSADFIEHAMSGVTGAQHPRTSWHRISEFEVPSLTPDEQELMADILWKIHESLQSNESTLTTLEQLKQATMQGLFKCGLDSEAQKESEIGLIPASWAIAPLSSIAQIERGRFLHRPRNEPRFYGGLTPFVQTGDVVRSCGRLTEYTQTLNEDGVSISRVFPKGTILITIAANIGFTGILGFDAACPDSLVAITPSKHLDAAFLEYFLRTQQSEMDRRAPKGTQKNINIQFLNPWPIPVPEMKEQYEIVGILDAIDQKIDLHKRKKAILEELFKTLLHKLMTCELQASELRLSMLRTAEEIEAMA